MREYRIAIIGFFLLVYVLPLGARPLVVPDEVRYAEIPREMLVSGDWIVPHLDGLRYFEKPPLGYWLNAISIKLFGENAFAVRLPPALSVGVSALLLFLAVRRFAGGEGAGILAAMVFLSCSAVFAIGVFAVLDSVFSMFVTATMLSFYCAYAAGTRRSRMAFLALSGASCGLAFLTKGFIAFAIPVVAIVPFLFWERRGKEIPGLAWVPLLVAAAVALPWSVAVVLREPDFWRYFLWIEHIQRFMGEDPQHAEPFYYYLPVLVGGALPWTAFVPASVVGLKKIGTKDAFVRYALCWLLFPFLFFSLSRGKLGTYILPCFAPLAILVTVGLRKYLEQGKRRLFSASGYSLAAIACIAASGLAISQVTGFPDDRIYGRNEFWKWFAAVAGLMMLAGFAILAVRSTLPRKAILMVGLAPLVPMFFTHFLMPERLRNRKAPGAFLLRQADQVRPNRTLITSADLAHAVCWFYRRDDVLLVNDGELDYGLQYADSEHRRIDVDWLADLVREKSGEDEIILILSPKRYKTSRKHLPAPVFETTAGAFAFGRFECGRRHRAAPQVRCDLIDGSITTLDDWDAKLDS